MADSADITNPTNLPEQPERRPSPVADQDRRLDSPPSDTRVSKPPQAPPSSETSLLFANIANVPSVRAPDSSVASLLAAPVSSQMLPPAGDVESAVSSLLKTLTINGYPVSYDNGNLSVQLPTKALVSDSPSSTQGLTRREQEMDARVASDPRMKWNWGASALASPEERASFERVQSRNGSSGGNAASGNTPSGGQATPLTTSSSSNTAPTGGSETGGDSGKGNTETGSPDAPSSGKSQTTKDSGGKPDTEDLLSDRKRVGKEDQGQYRERKEMLKSFSDEAREAIRNGDTTLFGKGQVPIYFTRADNERKVLMYVQVSHTAVIEGAEGYERTQDLPPENGYYLGGGADSCVGLGLYSKDGEVWVNPGTVAGQVPPGFDPQDGKLIASGGSGDVWAEINVDQETGEVASVAVTGGSSTPTNSGTAFYHSIGHYSYGNNDKVTVVNYGCGPVNATICRNWFAWEPPFFGVNISR